MNGCRLAAAVVESGAEVGSTPRAVDFVSLADRPTHVDQIGVMYMFSGAWVPDLHESSHSPDHTYHVGPHVMIITPHNEDLAKFSRDGSTGQIYVSHLPGRSELYLIMPFKDESQ